MVGSSSQSISLRHAKYIRSGHVALRSEFNSKHPNPSHPRDVSCPI